MSSRPRVAWMLALALGFAGCATPPRLANDAWIDSYRFDRLSEPAPEVTFADEHGKSHALSEFRGKAVLIHFWASWCEPCKKELPELARLSTTLDRERWVVLPISIDPPEDLATVETLVRNLKPRPPLYLWQPSAASRKYQTWGLPASYVIAPDGMIVARAMGMRNWFADPKAMDDLNGAFAQKR